MEHTLPCITAFTRAPTYWLLTKYKHKGGRKIGATSLKKARNGLILEYSANKVLKSIFFLRL